MGRTPLVALSLVLVMLFSVLIPADVNNEVLGFQSTSEVSFKEDNWTNNGASRTDLNLSEQGKPVLERPELVWTSVSGSPIGVTGSAAVAIDELNQVWFIGGREDPNPAQSNDEVASTSVHIYDVANDSWISGNSMPFAQQYGGAERIGERVLVFGDWWPTNSNPVKDSSGMLQIYNMSNETWYEGASLPDGHMVGNYRSDGLVISTPTGSTAYSLSAGGPIIDPELSVFNIIPMMSQSLSSRALVSPNKKDISVEIMDGPLEHGMICVDGQENIQVNFGDEILISKNEIKLKIVHPKNNNFYESCREKLGWSLDITNTKPS